MNDQFLKNKCITVVIDYSKKYFEQFIFDPNWYEIPD